MSWDDLRRAGTPTPDGQLTVPVSDEEADCRMEQWSEEMREALDRLQRQKREMTTRTGAP